jgi:HKD family nuclease
METKIICPECGRVLKINGVQQAGFMVMEHKYAKGETLHLCAICYNSPEIADKYFWQNSNWKLKLSKMAEDIIL